MIYSIIRGGNEWKFQDQRVASVSHCRTFCLTYHERGIRNRKTSVAFLFIIVSIKEGIRYVNRLKSVCKYSHLNPLYFRLINQERHFLGVVFLVKETSSQETDNVLL